jgi:site-specific recombinase XerD
MFLVLLDTGIRASELLSLTVKNLDLSHSEMKVKGKGNKERVVPFGPTTKKALMLWTLKHHKESELVFHGFEGEPLTYTALAHLLKRLGEKAGVPRLHAHLLRHTCALRWLMSGGDVVSLKNLLGHIEVSTTSLYLHMASKDVQLKHQQFSPVETLRRRK